MCRPLLLLAARFWGYLGCFPDFHGNEMPTVLRSTTLAPQTSCKALWISVGVFPRKVSILMYEYDRWSLREIWLQSLFSSISRLRFAEQVSRSLLIRTQCSSLKSGPQLTRKSERLRHPTGRASAVCRTFEMTHVLSHSCKVHTCNTHVSSHFTFYGVQ